MKCEVLTSQCSSVKDHKKQVLKGPCIFVSFFVRAILERCLEERTYLQYFSVIHPSFKTVKHLAESSVERDNLVKENDINEVFLLLPLCQYSEMPSMDAVFFL